MGLIVIFLCIAILIAKELSLEQRVEELEDEIYNYIKGE